MDDRVISLGDRLRQRREALGLSQAQAARELDVARTAYRLWEMEAARPAPDRWRLIARWLGVSVATMLLAEDLIDASEAEQVGDISSRLRADSWDESSAGGTGDFFAQERAMIDRQADRGVITREESSDLGRIFTRIQATTGKGVSSGWRWAQLEKELPADPTAPSQARAAVSGTAAGIPPPALEAARLLTSGSVTESVRSAAGTAGVVGLRLTMSRDVLRVEVTDRFPRHVVAAPLDEPAPMGPRFLAALASRWGAGWQDELHVAWFELDLPPPGDVPA